MRTHRCSSPRVWMITEAILSCAQFLHIFPEIALASREEVLRDKEAAEIDLMSSGIEYTIIRNFRLRYQPLERQFLGTAYLTDDITVFGGISRADLAILTLSCLDGQKCRNMILHALDNGPMPPPAQR